MAQVLVRDLEPAVIEKLKKRAQQNRRSLEAELRLILQRAAGEVTTQLTPEVERVREMFAGRTFSDSAELIREDRER
jgi:plasmid stability protein